MYAIPPIYLHRIKLVGKFASTQIIVQILGAVSGFILIRTLSKQDYAYFTIANSMQSVMNVLADSGISIALSATGGKVWQDRYRFGQLINTAMQLRRWFALAATIIVTPIMVWMLISNQASITYTVLIAIAVLIELHFYLEIAVFGTIPRLHSQIALIQNLDIITVISRLTLLATGYLFYLNAAVAAFSSTVASGLNSFLLKRSISAQIDTKAEISHEDREYILGLAKNLFPSAIFFSIQGQLSIVLISFFGNTQQIAEVGALGRLGILFSVINSVMSAIVLPSFARCQSVTLLRKRYLQIVISFVGIGVILFGLTIAFPQQLLWILGSKYSDLEKELIWMISGSIVASIGGVMWSLCSVKGWVGKVWIEIPVRILLQIVVLTVIDVSTIRGVLMLGLISNFSPVIVSAWLASRGLKLSSTAFD